MGLKNFMSHLKVIPSLAVMTAFVIAFMVGPIFCAEIASGNSGPKVFLHLICDGGIDPAMVFQWKGGGGNSFAIEPGAVQRTSVSGLVHVSHPARPSVDSFFDQWGSKSAVLNGVGTSDLSARAIHGSALEVEVSAKRKIWLSSYAEDFGKGRPAPVITFPGVRFDGSPDEMSLIGRIPANLLTTTPPASSFPGSVRDRLFRDLRVDYTSYGSMIRSGSGDAIKIKGYDKQFRMQQVFEASIPTAFASVYNPAQPDFVNQAKLALEMFSSGKSLAAMVRVGDRTTWAAASSHFAIQSAAVETLFDGLDEILNHAYNIRLQTKLVLVVSGAYGRTPWLNAAGGKDPWPVSSMMFWGNGIRSGVTGATDDLGRGVKIDPRFGTTTGDTISLSFQNAYASMLFHAGGNYKKWTSALPVSGLLQGNQ